MAHDKSRDEAQVNEDVELDLHAMERELPHAEKLKKKAYEAELLLLQIELVKLQAWVQTSGARVLMLFEGRDAAGKGGAIKRFTEHLNPRGARVVALPKPNETERGQWYFQRYITHLPTAGEIVLFDRSWYNRAGVERVMGFSTPVQYGEFLRQAPELERNLVDAGLHLFKFWFTVSREEQARRFDGRRTDPLKVWKLSPTDEAALPRFDEYSAARDAMLIATDSAAAPWTVVNSNEKRRARLESIRHVLHQFDYDHRDDDVARAPDPRVVRPASEVLGGTIH
jgi:polyphosphate kinase 2